jgi:hypothetical protein
MRYLFGLLVFCSLGILPLIGCGDPQPVQCEMAADCNDGNDCTADLCDPSSKTCSHGPAVDGTKCNFGGLAGVCASGECEEDRCDGVDCNDDNECTDDACEPSDGSCKNTPVADDTECDFEGAPGLCKAGTCEDAKRCEAVDCRDGNECTDDVCDPVTGTCSNPPTVDGTPCAGGTMLCLGGNCGGACTTPGNAVAYSGLMYLSDDGTMSTGTEAAEAISTDCLLGSGNSVPPVVGCSNEVAAVLQCVLAPGCTQEVIEALEVCIVLCLQDTIDTLTGFNLTEGCAGCYGPNAACNISPCAVGGCVPHPGSEMCIECRCANECPQAFADCSGIPSDECN